MFRFREQSKPLKIMSYNQLLSRLVDFDVKSIVFTNQKLPNSPLQELALTLHVIVRAR